jgi:hypothetical protein
MRYKNVKHDYKIKYFTIFISHFYVSYSNVNEIKYFTIFISHFYVSYSNVNEITYIKAIVNCISKGLLSCSVKIFL